jgi:hypothetical protein
LWCRRRAGRALRLPSNHAVATLVRGDAKYVAIFNHDYIARNYDHFHRACDDRANHNANVARPDTDDADDRITDDNDRGAHDHRALHHDA